MKKKQSVATVDVLSHSLNPDMEILSESEKKKMLSFFKVTEKGTPKMLSTDAAAVALKAVPGDIVKIMRDDGTGKHPEYRTVV